MGRPYPHGSQAAPDGELVFGNVACLKRAMTAARNILRTHVPSSRADAACRLISREGQHMAQVLATDGHRLWCARLTGEGQPVEVRRKEGVTNHFRPESCAGRCEAAGEALTGARTGRDIEHRKRERRAPGWSAETVTAVEGNTDITAMVRGWRAPRCRRTHARSYVLRRDLGGLHSAPAVEPGPQREGGFRIR